jgi:tetratricopeptide (TPR) repeat protein
MAVFLPNQGQSQESATEEADALYQAEEWEKAAQAYEKVVDREPKNGRAWFRLGTSRRNLKLYQQAVAAFEEADKIGFAQPFSRYNIASGYALLNEKAKAFAWLDKAVEAGFANLGSLESDTDIASLREDARFGQVVEQVKINAEPCEHLPVYKQFDFWVGEWDVFTPQGQKAGTNRIERVAGGCILLENWTSARGPYKGKSINYYDPSKGKWVQAWVDSSAMILPIEGEFKEGAMHFQGEFVYRKGNKDLFRGTWTPLPDGRVRQFLEQSKDGGETWNTWFDGYYVRKD